MGSNGILASIDVGTSKVCTIVAEIRNGNIAQILGEGIVPSRGIQKAIVVDISEPTAAIRQSVLEAEHSSGLKIKSAYVGITGRHIKSFNNQATVAISRRDHLVTEKALRQVIKSSSKVALPENRKLIHAIPRHYSVDGQTGIKNPVGMHGYRLDVETHIITAGVTFARNLVKCVQGAGIEVMDLILEPIADSEAVLEAEEKESGVILADIGAGTTDITVFKERDIWHSSALPVAGYQVTKDLAIGLGIPFNVAEEMKKKYGSVMPLQGDEPETVSLGTGKLEVSYGDLRYIIRARLEEILRLVFLDVPRAEWETWEPSGLVICGGTANSPGIEVLGREILALPTRIGKPLNLPQGAIILDDPTYATGLGLLLWGARYGEQGAPHSGNVLRRFFSQLARRWSIRPRIRVSLDRGR
jgi:cell division protein FtsA